MTLLSNIVWILIWSEQLRLGGVLLQKIYFSGICYLTSWNMLVHCSTFYGSDIFLHRDKNLMPRNPAAWSAWNFLGTVDTKVCVTYWLNILQVCGNAFDSPFSNLSKELLHNTCSYITYRILKTLDRLTWWLSIRLVHQKIHCLSGQQVIQCHQLLPQRLLLSFITFKGRGEYGSVELTKVNLHFILFMN